MSGSDFKHDGGWPEKDIVAIFHASFHPTKGNVVDWCLKSYNDLNLDGVEFSVLPSGLHVVERDTIYFSQSCHAGVAVFRRRPTQTHGHRGFRLSSFGILVRDAQRPRPWLYLDALKKISDAVYTSADAREERADSDGQSSTGNDGDLQDTDFEPAKKWFEEWKADKPVSRRSWESWSNELDGLYSCPDTPTIHLPHLLRMLGLSSLTLYKFVLARRRILIVTPPPVECAGILAWVAADMCLEHHLTLTRGKKSIDTPIASMFGAKTTKRDEDDEKLKHGPRVLGMISLNDLSRLEAESASGCGWIACTTDTIFLEKPAFYDLVIDLTVCAQSRGTGRIVRPTMQMSRRTRAPPNPKRKSGPSYKLETIRFTWSDMKLWAEIDRLLKIDANNETVEDNPPFSFSASPSSTSANAPLSLRWNDALQLYEDMCLLCATIWIGSGTWRSTNRNPLYGNISEPPGNWGAARLDGLDEDWTRDLNNDGPRTRIGGRVWSRRWTRDGEGGSSGPRLRLRSLGQGGDRQDVNTVLDSPNPPRVRFVTTAPKGIRKLTAPTSASSMLPAEASTARTSEGGETLRNDDEDADLSAEDEATLAEERQKQNAQTTLSLLQAFNSNTLFWLSALREILPPPSALSSPISLSPRSNTGKRYQRLPSEEIRPSVSEEDEDDIEVITISARDMLTLELGILSDLDSKFVEWLAEAEGYSGPSIGRKIVVKRTWQDVLGIVFGLR